MADAAPSICRRSSGGNCILHQAFFCFTHDAAREARRQPTRRKVTWTPPPTASPSAAATPTTPAPTACEAQASTTGHDAPRGGRIPTRPTPHGSAHTRYESVLASVSIAGHSAPVVPPSRWNATHGNAVFGNLSAWLLFSKTFPATAVLSPHRRTHHCCPPRSGVETVVTRCGYGGTAQTILASGAVGPAMRKTNAVVVLAFVLPVPANCWGKSSTAACVSRRRSGIWRNSCD